MASNWPTVSIGIIAREISRPEQIDNTRMYRLLGAHWYAKGLYVKEEKLGSEIRATTLFAVRPGDFVYNRLFAWKGSFALAKGEHKGCYVSNEFPCFELDPERIVPQFLWLYFSREQSWREALGLSSGSTPTSRNRLKQERFLAMKIPLPPLPEQRRIVARIEELAGQIEEARGLRKNTREEAGILTFEAFREIAEEGVAQKDWPIKLLSTVCEVNPSRKNRANLLDTTRVTFVPMSAVDAHSGAITQAEVRAFAEVKQGYKLFLEGDIIFARITPCMQNGKAAIARDLLAGVGLGSTEFHVLRPGKLVTAEWIHRIVRQPSFRQDAEAHFRGSAGQQRVPQSFLENYRIPVPPLSEQRRIVAHLGKLQTQVNELTMLQDSSQPELDSLLPAILEGAFRGEL